MDITRYAIEKRRITAVVLLLVLIAAIMVYRKMPRDEDPGFIIRTAFVSTYLPGASPERVEQLVTDKLEKAIQEMPEIDYISSISKTGASLIYVNIQEGYKKRYVGAHYENIVILTRHDGTKVRLGDIARVIDGFEDSDRIARFNGKKAVMVNIC